MICTRFRLLLIRQKANPIQLFVLDTNETMFPVDYKRETSFIGNGGQKFFPKLMEMQQTKVFKVCGHSSLLIMETSVSDKSTLNL